MTYDVIGDIHGHAEELRTLLRQLGYEERNGGYVAEGRNAIFVGDFIDRGPAIREVLQIARAMVSRNGAYAVLGNHEFNALCYHTPDRAGSFLRPHSTKNAHQHQATVDQLVLPYPEEWRSYQQWFKDLPLFLEIDGLRVVHAAWDENAIRLVRGRSFYDPDFLAAAATRGTPEFTAVETLLKGPEIKLPDGQMCADRDRTYTE
jgi:predicted MPP superfamily phosphohydrolase